MLAKDPSMTALDIIKTYQDEMTAIRRDFHIHPELGLEEVRTAEIVAQKLESWGIEVHRKVGVTGVVGVIRKGTSGKRIGLRADMDCLPMDEMTNLPYRSQTAGKMHACGHDGHTTMLLAAAKYLAQADFNGTVNLIFQPGEEGMGGALAMLNDDLFGRFPCDTIYALHNRPGLPIGQFCISQGPSSAGGAFFDIKITGVGAHGARPEVSVDPVLIASHIVTALQSIVARNVPPSETAVLSVTRITSGEAYNVIPESAQIAGTARAFNADVMTKIEAHMKRIAKGVAEGFGASAEVDFRVIFAPLINDAEPTQHIANAAALLVGDQNVDRNKPPSMGSEDFSFMMQQVPGAYIQVGNGDSAQLHNPAYDFNDACTPYGAAVLATVAEQSLKS
jgi:hippurate hydrolase